jgi:glutathione-regulated potassium-efflux system ancillary protein KefC
MQTTLFEIFVFLAAACVVVPLASRFKLGAVIGYLLAGIIIGPFALGFITDTEKVMHFAEFGVVMMLFVIGLELEPAVLWRLRKSIVGLGGLQMTLTIAAFTMIGIMLGYSWQMSVAVSMALALSSTALVLQMLKEKNLMNTSVGESSFSVLLFQDIAVIPILVLMPLLAVAGVEGGASHASLISGYPGYVQALIVASVIALVILGGHYVSSHLFRAIAKTNLREIFTALSLALVVGITLLMQMVGVSPALGAFVAGVVLANSEYRRTLETDIEPFKGLLLGLFFISVGMGIDFGLLMHSPLMILAAVALLMSVKASILWVLGRFFGLLPMHNIGYALALSQGGEFAFVLFQFAGLLAILPLEYNQFLTLVVALSIAATPLVMLWYNAVIVPRFMSTIPERPFDTIHEQHSIIIAGFGRFGQVIVRFLIAQGIKVTVLEKDPDQIELLRKFGFKGHFGDATRLDLLRSAGAEKAKLLIVAVDDVGASLDIVRLAKEEFPSLTLFARARNRQHAYDLHKLGAHYFKRELFDSSLDMAKEIMVWLGGRESDIAFKAEQFRRHDEATLKESFQFFEDQSALVNFAKTRRTELENILLSDGKRHFQPTPNAE